MRNRWDWPPGQEPLTVDSRQQKSRSQKSGRAGSRAIDLKHSSFPGSAWERPFFMDNKNRPDPLTLFLGLDCRFKERTNVGDCLRQAILTG